MIAYLRGRIIYRDVEKSSIILETNGVGYEVYMPFRGGYQDGGSSAGLGGNPVSLFIYTYVREDRITLYGFETTLQKEIFSLLLDVKDVGPKLAVTILSSISAGNLVNIFTAQDVSALCGIKGIGRAKAERIIMELKNKILKKTTLSNDINAGDLCLRAGYAESANGSGTSASGGVPAAEEGMENKSAEAAGRSGGLTRDVSGVTAPRAVQPSDIIMESAGALEALGYSKLDSFNLASKVFGILKENGEVTPDTECLTKECLKHIYSKKNLRVQD